MKIIKLKPQGMFAVNSYLVVSDKNNAVLIDAPEGAESILAEIEKQGVKLNKILLTHGHCDHIETVAELAEKTGAEVFIHTNDAPKLTDSYLNLSEYFSMYTDEVRHYNHGICVDDGDTIIEDEMVFTVFHTPGHTSGCVCYILEDVIFSGDTLFRDSIGRTDMPDGDPIKLFASLKLLEEFEGRFDDYRLLSGHGAESTLSREKLHNPYLRGNMFE